MEEYLLSQLDTPVVLKGTSWNRQGSTSTPSAALRSSLSGDWCAHWRKYDVRSKS